jgi:hypothetical protein
MPFGRLWSVILRKFIVAGCGVLMTGRAMLRGSRRSLGMAEFLRRLQKRDHRFPRAGNELSDLRNDPLERELPQWLKPEPMGSPLHH